jgi:hypothetical protein
VRLYSKNYTGTIFSFRLGNNGLIRVNQNQVLEFYNNTGISTIGFNGVTPSSENNVKNVRWIKGDFLFDWDSYTVRTFLNGTYYAKDNFYYEDKFGFADGIMIYNLKGSTTGFIKDVKLCAASLCDGFKGSNLGIAKIALLVVLGLGLTFLF